jgi:hypothetical protein
LSYNFVEGKKLSMSNFEGYLAASYFNTIDHIEFYERSLSYFNDISKKYASTKEKIVLDKNFDTFIKNQKAV